jgi:hypothetical protein
MMLEALQPEGMIEAGNRLLKRMEEMNRTWVGSLHQVSESSWDLAGHLARCSDPMEVNRVCTDWLKDRRDAMLADGKRLSDMWFKLYEDELTAAPRRPAMSGEGPSPVSRIAAAE